LRTAQADSFRALVENNFRRKFKKVNLFMEVATVHR